MLKKIVQKTFVTNAKEIPKRVAILEIIKTYREDLYATERIESVEVILQDDPEAPIGVKFITKSLADWEKFQKENWKALEAWLTRKLKDTGLVSSISSVEEVKDF